MQKASNSDAHRLASVLFHNMDALDSDQEWQQLCYFLAECEANCYSSLPTLTPPLVQLISSIHSCEWLDEDEDEFLTNFLIVPLSFLSDATIVIFANSTYWWCMEGRQLEIPVSFDEEMRFFRKINQQRGLGGRLERYPETMPGPVRWFRK